MNLAGLARDAGLARLAGETIIANTTCRDGYENGARFWTRSGTRRRERREVWGDKNEHRRGGKQLHRHRPADSTHPELPPAGLRY